MLHACAHTHPGSPRTLIWLAWFECSQPRGNCDQLRMHAGRMLMDHESWWLYAPGAQAGGFSRRQLQGLAPPRRTVKRRTPTIHSTDRQSAQLTDQAPGTSGRAAHESCRITPTCTPNPGQHHTDPAGSSPESSQPTQPSTRRSCRRAEPHYNTDTTRVSGDTRHRPLGAPVIRRH